MQSQHQIVSQVFAMQSETNAGDATAVRKAIRILDRVVSARNRSSTRYEFRASHTARSIYDSRIDVLTTFHCLLHHHPALNASIMAPKRGCISGHRRVDIHRDFSNVSINPWSIVPLIYAPKGQTM